MRTYVRFLMYMMQQWAWTPTEFT